MSRVLCVATIVLLAACDTLGLGLNHYHDSAIAYKAQCDKNARELKLANVAIIDIQMHQRGVAAFDAKYSRKLTDVGTENETLYADVAADRKRLRINATCPGPVRGTTGTTRVDNATDPQLVGIAKWDYFIPREWLVITQRQLGGAQEYIRTQYTKLAFYYPEDT